MTYDPVLLNDWHPVATVAELDETPISAIRLPDEDINVSGCRPGRGDTVVYTYVAPRPLTAYLLKESEGPRFSILLVITPHNPVESSAWMWMAMNYGHDLAEQDLVGWQDSIFYQDKPIVASHRPKCLPLDPGAELSMRPDKTAVAYRRWLRELGMTFGVEN